MRKWILVLVAALVVAAAAAGVLIERRNAAPGASVTAALPPPRVGVPAPLSTPAASAAPAAAAASDLPTVAVAEHPIHDVPGGPAAVLNFTLLTRDGRAIEPAHAAPASGAMRR